MVKQLHHYKYLLKMHFYHIHKLPQLTYIHEL